ncbi:MAG: alanyl-tRNA editing protein [Candidatus Koribacter versatilis]|uniref:Alanine--tRNA ligase n=1 Tax=Candidatus Korobacter versatilis TaxID=658062 RepID=A0A932EQE0_9BACT|nr:alanyl-tRNA editing protein [Candidatus Koribacter versatilis]
MTERLYYPDSFLYEFDAKVVAVVQRDGRTAVVLDRSAFYPTSGGQLNDTGVLETGSSPSLPIIEVTEDEDTGTVFHFVEGTPPAKGSAVHGRVDVARRREHMQQHTGQHVLSAAFEKLFGMPTVSFHMGAETCTVDLEGKALTPAQLEKAGALANEVVLDDRVVTITYATPEEAKQRNVRKLPPLKAGQEKLRLIDVAAFDLNACGGTHVQRTGQIGAVLLRRLEKVKQGFRVEFVCGARAVGMAQRDYAALTDAAGKLSTHIYELPQQIVKQAEEAKAAAKGQQRLLEELAALHADRLLAETAEKNGRRLIAQTFPDRSVEFVKFLAHKLTADVSRRAVALLASTAGQPTVVFACTVGLELNMGELLKDAVTARGGRGGGSKEIAQGGVPAAADAEAVVSETAQKIQGP